MTLSGNKFLDAVTGTVAFFVNWGFICGMLSLGILLSHDRPLIYIPFVILGVFAFQFPLYMLAAKCKEKEADAAP